jgi:hypothetical protein
MEAWRRKYGLSMGIDDFPKVLESAWYSAHSPPNIKSGFATCGIFPPNFNWVRVNNEKLQSHNLTNEQRFNLLLRKTELTIGSIEERLKYSGYLDPAVPAQLRAQTKGVSQSIDHLLAAIYGQTVQNRFSDDMRTTERKNRLGEPFKEAKILNSVDRIEKLRDVRQLKIEK